MTTRILAALALSIALATPASAQAKKESPEKFDPKSVPAAPAGDASSMKFDPNQKPVAPPPDSPPPAPGAIGVPAQIFALRISGKWEADGKKGFSRVVGVMEAGKQKFFVQWLSMPDGLILQTKPLEDEEAEKLVFGDIRAEPESGGGMTVFMDTEPDRDGLRDTWVLVVGEPGDARFGPATN